MAIQEPSRKMGQISVGIEMQEYEVMKHTLIAADDANIPVNLIITPPDETDHGMWELTGHQFQPRRDTICQDVYEYRAAKRETLVEIVRRYVVPLYINALTRLQVTGELYFWSDIEIPIER